MMDWNSGMGGGAWVFMGIFWIALLAAILFLVVRLLPSNGRSAASQQDSPEEILDRRFAHGDIDVQTYQTQRTALAAARGKR